MPTLQPAAKPRVSVLPISVAWPWRATISGVPSVDALSTTMTSTTRSAAAAGIEARQGSMTPAESWVTMTTERSTPRGAVAFMRPVVASGPIAPTGDSLRRC